MSVYLDVRSSHSALSPRFIGKPPSLYVAQKSKYDKRRRLVRLKNEIVRRTGREPLRGPDRCFYVSVLCRLERQYRMRAVRRTVAENSVARHWEGYTGERQQNQH